MIAIRFIAVALAAFLVSCANPQGTSVSARQAAYNAYDRPASLPANPGNVRVKVSIDKSMAYVLEGDKPLLVMPVGVGKAATPTPQGSFRIFNKQHYRRANTHGFGIRNGQVRRTYLKDRLPGESFKGTPMPYWCEFKPAYGFHTGWIRPYPHTNGCIRMHFNVAPKFFKLVSNGTPVHIARSQPEDATLGNIPLPPSADGLVDHPADYYLSDKYFTEHKTPRYE
jgi:lipoprotein-anchoring transpeptidase ErfK/SrfK